MWYFPTTCWNNGCDGSDDCSGCSDSGAATPLETAYHSREQWRGAPAARVLARSTAPQAPVAPRRPQRRVATPLQPLWLSNTYVHSYFFLLRTRSVGLVRPFSSSCRGNLQNQVGPTDKEQVVCLVDAANNASAISVSFFFFLLVDVLGDAFHRHASRCTHDSVYTLQPNRIPRFLLSNSRNLYPLYVKFC